MMLTTLAMLIVIVGGTVIAPPTSDCSRMLQALTLLITLPNGALGLAAWRYPVPPRSEGDPPPYDWSAPSMAPVRLRSPFTLLSALSLLICIIILVTGIRHDNRRTARLDAQLRAVDERLDKLRKADQEASDMLRRKTTQRDDDIQSPPKPPVWDQSQFNARSAESTRLYTLRAQLSASRFSSGWTAYSLLMTLAGILPSLWLMRLHWLRAN